MAAWSLVVEEGGSCQTYKCTDGINWEECTSEDYREAMARYVTYKSGKSEECGDRT